MGFWEGFLGIEFSRRPSQEELIAKEETRLFSRKVRRHFEEAQELEELKGFLERKPYLAQDKTRPDNFKEYVGQTDVKKMVEILIKASKLKNSFFPHTLFWGEAGLGKTTISYLIAKELGAKLIITSGGQLETKDELLNVFKQFSASQPNILFIDEIHALPRKITEMIYSAMEDYRFDYTTKYNKAVNLNLPSFTLLGATTDLAKLLIPIRQRFQGRFHLEPYTLDELSQIVQNYLVRIAYYPVACDTLREIAKRSRNIARYAINYTKNLVDYCFVEHLELKPETAKKYFDKEGIDKEGLTRYDRAYLKILLSSGDFRAGLSTIVKTSSIDKRTVEQEIEPFLLRKNFVVIGSRGRELTGTGFDYIAGSED